MTSDAHQNPAVIEPSPHPEDQNPTASSLRQRIRQQELLAELGYSAADIAALGAQPAGDKPDSLRPGGE